MDTGYDDSNNVFSKNLGIFNYLLYNVHKINSGGKFLYKIRHAGPVCGGGTGLNAQCSIGPHSRESRKCDHVSFNFSPLVMFKRLLFWSN